MHRKALLIMFFVFATSLARQRPVRIRKLTLPAGAGNLFVEIDTTFSCDGKVYGYYADVYNDCKIYHVCHPTFSQTGSRIALQYSFMCPEHTIFDQKTLICARPSVAVTCDSAADFYNTNKIFQHSSISNTSPQSKNEVNGKIDKSEDDEECIEEDVTLPITTEVTTDFRFQFPEAEEVHASNGDQENDDKSSGIHAKTHIENSYYKPITTVSNDASDGSIIQSTNDKEFSSGETPDDILTDSIHAQNENVGSSTVKKDFASPVMKTTQESSVLTEERILEKLRKEQVLKPIIEDEKIPTSWRPEDTTNESKVTSADIVIYDRNRIMKMSSDTSKEDFNTYNHREMKQSSSTTHDVTTKSFISYLNHRLEDSSSNQNYFEVLATTEGPDNSGAIHDFINATNLKMDMINNSRVANSENLELNDDETINDPPKMRIIGDIINITRESKEKIVSRDTANLDYMHTETEENLRTTDDPFYQISEPETRDQSSSTKDKPSNGSETEANDQSSSTRHEPFYPSETGTRGESMSTKDEPSYRSETSTHDQSEKSIVCELKQNTKTEDQTASRIIKYPQLRAMQPASSTGLFEFSYPIPVAYAISVPTVPNTMAESENLQKFAHPVQFIYPSHVIFPSKERGDYVISRIQYKGVAPTN
ncbi:protein starmaker-like [Centruroides vittatus]|uniref:protein starmaker-like n=1 Tax=Centruroides vittatus TaxID=120091 RepID=UPI00350F453B